MMKRRNVDSAKLRRNLKRSRISDGICNSALVYIKFMLVWAFVMTADFLLEFRFEFLWPFWLLLRSVYDSCRYQGLAFSVFFVCVAITSDMVCFLFIPVQWLFFLASTYVWVQYVWHTDRGICLPTVCLWCLFVYIEAAVRLKELKNMPFTLDLCRPFAAHCIGYPVVTLGFGVKSYVGFKYKLRKQREIAKENYFYMQLLHEALPAPLDHLRSLEDSSLKALLYKPTTDETAANGISNGALTQVPTSATSNGTTSLYQGHNASLETVAASSALAKRSAAAAGEKPASLPGSAAVSGSHHQQQQSRKRNLQTEIARSTPSFLQQSSRKNSIINSNCTNNHKINSPSTATVTGESETIVDTKSTLAYVICFVKSLFYSSSKANEFTSDGASGNNSSNAGGKRSLNGSSSSLKRGYPSSDQQQQRFGASSDEQSDADDDEANVDEEPAEDDGEGDSLSGDELANNVSSISAFGECFFKRFTGGSANLTSADQQTSTPVVNGHATANSAAANNYSSKISSSKASGRGRSEGRRRAGTGDSNSVSADSLHSTSTKDQNSPASNNNNVASLLCDLSSSKDKVQNKDLALTLESDIDKLKCDLRSSRVTEVELRQQIQQLTQGDKSVKNELQQLRQTNDQLQTKLHNLVRARQQDKQAMASLEKRVSDESKLRVQAETALQQERKLKKAEEAAAARTSAAVAASSFATAAPIVVKSECSDMCKAQKRDSELELKSLKRDLRQREDCMRQMEIELQNLRQYKETHDTEALVSALSTMQDKNAHLENSLSAETRIKLDLFSALGDAKRQLEITHNQLHKKELESDELRRQYNDLILNMRGGSPLVAAANITPTTTAAIVLGMQQSDHLGVSAAGYHHNHMQQQYMTGAINPAMYQQDGSTEYRGGCVVLNADGTPVIGGYMAGHSGHPAI